MIAHYLNVSNSYFLDNNASGPYSSAAIFYTNSEITEYSTFYNCTFMRNSATTSGIFEILLGYFVCIRCNILKNSVLQSIGNSFFILSVIINV